MKEFNFGILLLFALNTKLINAYDQMPEIKIKVADFKNVVMIEGLDLKKKRFEKVHFYPGKSQLKINCSQTEKNRRLQGPLLASLSSHTGIVNFQKRKFTGSLELIANAHQDACEVIHRVPLETYISSVLAKEMSPDWPLEALKAQAVAARSYAFFMLKSERMSRLGGKAYHLENSERHQVTGGFDDQSASTSRATKSTFGEILVAPSGSLVPIFFHSKCGGRTLRPEDVWGNPVEGYVSVNCPLCYFHGKKDWKFSLSKEDFRAVLQAYGKQYKLKTRHNFQGPLSFLPDRGARSYLHVYDGEQKVMVKKAFFRQQLGRKKLPSHNIRIYDSPKRIYFYGQGYGHGVGMCQYGAYELARRGWDYKKILAFYFPKHELKKIY